MLVYELACHGGEGHKAPGLTDFACAQFQNTTTGALKVLSKSVNSTRENVLQFLSLLVDVIYEDQTYWDTPVDDDVPHITERPLRNFVCAAAARIWEEAQEWKTAQLRDETGEDRTGEDIVKKALEMLCWNNTRFGQDFATWMLGKGIASITLKRKIAPGQRMS
jgi:hypothetical protein